MALDGNCNLAVFQQYFDYLHQACTTRCRNVAKLKFCHLPSKAKIEHQNSASRVVKMGTLGLKVELGQY